MSTLSIPPLTTSSSELHAAITELRKHKRVIFLNASALSNSACLYRYYLSSIAGVKPLGLNIAIEFGNAFHKFLEAYRVTGDYAASAAQAQFYFGSLPIDTSLEDMRDIPLLFKVCAAYAEKYGEGKDDFVPYKTSDGKLLVEQTFAWPAYEDEQLVIFYSGTIDAVGEQRNVPCFSDAKTTAVWRNRDTYLRGFERSHQMMFYRYMLNMLGEKLGCDLLKDMPYFMDVVFLGKSNITLERTRLITPSQRDIFTFKIRIENFLKTLVDSLKLKYWPKDGLVNGACSENKYGGNCPYFGLCNSLDDAAEQFYRDSNFTVTEYNPLSFRD